MPEVSIVIPNYNHAPYLKERIGSVLDQTFQDFEVIILDDCSSDNSVAIIETYRKHPKVSHILINSVNSGSTFKQWEKGIGVSSGKWIWIAESDDWCEKTFLETFIPALDKDKNCSVAFCQSHAIDSSGRIIMTTSSPRMEEIIPGREFINSRMLHKNSIFNASMSVFQKQRYYEVSRKFTNYRFCGDWLFWIEMASRGNVFISGKVLNYFRKHERDVSGNAFKSGLFYEEYLKLADDLQEMQFIEAKKKKKLIKDNFSKYYFEKAADKTRANAIVKKYKSELGHLFYFASVTLFYEKCKNRLFLISLAVKRRLKSRSHV